MTAVMKHVTDSLAPACEGFENIGHKKCKSN
jgi:hypothetical protein